MRASGEAPSGSGTATPTPTTRRTRASRDNESTPGNRGVWMLRRDLGENTEFLMFTLWESLDAVKRSVLDLTAALAADGEEPASRAGSGPSRSPSCAHSRSYRSSTASRNPSALSASSANLQRPSSSPSSARSASSSARRGSPRPRRVRLTRSSSSIWWRGGAVARLRPTGSRSLRAVRQQRVQVPVRATAAQPNHSRSMEPACNRRAAPTCTWVDALAAGTWKEAASAPSRACSHRSRTCR